MHIGVCCHGCDHPLAGQKREDRSESRRTEAREARKLEGLKGEVGAP